MPQEDECDSVPILTFDAPLENGDLEEQEQLASEDKQGNNDSGLIKLRLIASIEELKKENQRLFPMVSEHVEKCLLGWSVFKTVNTNRRQVKVPKLHTDVNLVMDALPSGIIKKVHQVVKLMVLSGLEKECCQLYSSWRREFLQECLWGYGLKELNMVDVDLMEKIRCWKKALTVAVKILFPMETRLCDRVFFTLSSTTEISFAEVCSELAIRLLSVANAFINVRHLPDHLSIISKVEETFSEVQLKFESLFSGMYSESIKNELHAVRKRMGEATMDIFIELEDFIHRDMEEQACIRRGEPQPVVSQTMKRVSYFSDVILRNVFEDFSRVPKREGRSSFSIQISRIVDLLISNLEAKSKNYTYPALGYVFMMNNLNHLRQLASTLGFIVDSELLAKLTMKVQQYLELYKSSSWNKLLDYLKLEGNVAAETLKEKLHLFNLHFQEICSDQSTWIIFDMELREQIIKSIENILLPAYGNFIGRFHDVVGKRVYEYIALGLVDIQDGLNFLFLGTERS